MTFKWRFGSEAGFKEIGKKARLHYARQVLSDAQRLCPVDTGTLQDSLTIQDEGDTSYIGSSVDYAAYPELGLSSVPAYPVQPYLRPALYRRR